MTLNSLKNPTLLVFIVTSCAYAVNALYETAKLLSYNLPPDFFEVKIHNFLITGIIMGGIVLGVYSIHRIFYGIIERRIEGGHAIAYAKELVALAMTSLIAMGMLLLVPLYIHYRHYEHLTPITDWAWVIGAVLLLLTSAYILQFAFRARKEKVSYSKYLNNFASVIYKNKTRSRATNSMTVIYALGILLGITLIQIMGLSASSSRGSVSVISAPNERIANVIVGTYQGRYIIKEYDTHEKRYLDNYTLTDMTDKKVTKLDQL